MVPTTWQVWKNVVEKLAGDVQHKYFYHAWWTDGLTEISDNSQLKTTEYIDPSVIHKDTKIFGSDKTTVLLVSALFTRVLKSQTMVLKWSSQTQGTVIFLIKTHHSRAPHDAQNARRSRTRTLFHSLESCFVRGLHPLKLQPEGGFTL